MAKVEILECTLRDGSYPIDFQFTAEDTEVIAAGLEAAGFNRIEIGHGLGMGASKTEIGISAASDQEYLEAAAVLKKAKYGMFFIPGIADTNHLALAGKYNMDFVRIGINANESEQAEVFIKQAKDLGMEVFANFMKTYAIPIEEVVVRASTLKEWGADIIVVVDSAGGMMPDEVRKYVSTLKKDIGGKIGFHGHNNLQLAIANTLVAIDSGADIVDTTLRGVGRSSGNAQTEVLVMILDKMGINPGIDIYKTMDLGENLIGPLAGGRGVDAIELTTGYALFHSGFLNTIYSTAKKLGVDPRELIIRVSEIDKITVTEELATKVADQIRAEQLEVSRPQTHWNFHARWRGHSLDQPGERGIEKMSGRIAREVKILASKNRKTSVFTIAQSLDPELDMPAFPFLRSNASHVIGNVEVRGIEQALAVASAVDGIVDVILIDCIRHTSKGGGLIHQIQSVVQKSRLLTYRDMDAMVAASDAFIAQAVSDIAGKVVGICGLKPLGWKMAVALAERGARVFLFDSDLSEADWITGLNRGLDTQAGTPDRITFTTSLKDIGYCDVIVGATPKVVSINQGIVDLMKSDSVIYDMGIGTVSKEAVRAADKRGIRLYRLDMRSGLSSEVVNVLETAQLLDNIVGTGEIVGLPVVAGGVIGRRGDIVVDSISLPSQVIGIADGTGSLLSMAEEMEFHERLQRVKQAMLESKLS